MQLSLDVGLSLTEVEVLDSLLVVLPHHYLPSRSLAAWWRLCQPPEIVPLLLLFLKSICWIIETCDSLWRICRRWGRWNRFIFSGRECPICSAWRVLRAWILHLKSTVWAGYLSVKWVVRGEAPESHIILFLFLKSLLMNVVATWSQ